MGVKIQSIGSYRPKQSPEDALEHKKSLEGESEWEEWINFVAGNLPIAYSSSYQETAMNLASHAIADCLEKSRTPADQIDLIIHLCNIPDHLLGEATKIQRLIGATHAASYQIKNTACAGVLAAFLQASIFINSGIYEKVLVVCVSNLALNARKIMDIQDAHLEDLATATLFSKCEGQSGFINFHSETKSEWERISYLLPLDHSKTGGLRGNGDLNKFHDVLAQGSAKTMKQALEKASLQSKDISWLITLNAREEFLDLWRQGIGIEESRHLHTFHEVENCSFSSIPYTLMRSVEQNKLQHKDKVLFFAQGSGLHLISLVWEW
ncbi:MAG: hypothetical protein HUU50_15630 [Candidatus Brocadiae bacterium]|nr:hypothetical protein [Candidatus Brocadiia bacterium]